MVTGIIYKIECNVTGEVYDGSTQQGLNKRMIGHKTHCKAWKKGTTNYITSYNIIERGNYSYSLIEIVEFEDRTQLEAREGYYIKNNQCINRIIPGKTKEQIKEQKKLYQQVNKDKIKERKKVHYQANKDFIKEHQKQRYLKQKQLKEINQLQQVH